MKNNGTQPGQHYVGLDISVKSTSICVEDQNGKIVFESTVDTDPKAIGKCLNQQNLQIAMIGIESGAMSRYLVRELRNEGFPVTCINAFKMSKMLSARANKTDKNDARAIAQAMRVGIFSSVHVKSDEAADWKTTLTVRATLVKQRVEQKNTVRGILRDHGIRLPGLGHANFVDKVRERLAKSYPVLLAEIEALLMTYQVMHAQCIEMDRKVRRVARANDQMKLLQTIPGIGPVVAMSYLAEIDDPSRFKKSKIVGAYLGMTPSQYSSGETVRMGRISRRGNSSVRWLLYEAAMVLLMRSQKWSKLKAWGLRLAKRSGIKKAAVAVGRKLSVIMHRMLLTGESFRFTEETV